MQQYFAVQAEKMNKSFLGRTAVFIRSLDG